MINAEVGVIIMVADAVWLRLLTTWESSGEPRMRKSVYLFSVLFTMSLVGCGVSDVNPHTGGDYGARIVGLWEMVEDRKYPRHNPPTESIEFTEQGGFVLSTNGKVEMEGRFRVEKDKLIL